MRAAIRRRTAAGIGAVAVVALTGGCGFLSALADPRTPAVPPSAAAAAPTTAATAPVGTAAADLVGSADRRPASLAVSVQPAVATGSGVRAVQESLAADCRLSVDPARYQPVTLVFTDRGGEPTKATGVSTNLRLDLAVAGGSGVGLVVRSDGGSECGSGSTLPVQATLQTVDLAGEHQTLTVWVVAERAAGDADPLRGARLELRHPRRRADDVDPRAWTWGVQRVTAGSTCPGDPDSLCVPLG